MSEPAPRAAQRVPCIRAGGDGILATGVLRGRAAGLPECASHGELGETVPCRAVRVRECMVACACACAAGWRWRQRLLCGLRVRTPSSRHPAWRQRQVDGRTDARPPVLPSCIVSHLPSYRPDVCARLTSCTVKGRQ